MTAVDASPGWARTGRSVRAAGGAVTRLALRQVRRGALITIALLAGMSAMVATTYASTVGDALDAAALAALAENPAIRTLFGEPVALDDAGGFTVWRTGTVLSVLAGSWGLLAATRVTRGEEDARRWDLLAAGRIPLTSIVARYAAVLIGAVVVAGLAAGGALAAVGTSPEGALLHGVGLALTGAYFVAAGTLAAQIFPTRAGASGAAMALLGGALLVRMIGDGVDALGWLRWLSPFGLLALVQPYAANRILPIVVLAVTAAGLLAAAVLAARRRDVAGGWLATSAGRPPRLRLLGSVAGFAARRALRPLLGWAIGLAAYYLLIGLLALSMTEFLADNRRFGDLAAQAGFGGLGSVDGYAAALFALLAIPAGVFTAVRLAAVAADEADGRLTLLFAQPVTRLRLLLAELAVTASGAAALVAVAGLATWAGAAAVGAPLGLGGSLAGAMNVLPVALLCLGAAVLALGWLPRAVALVGALPATGGFLLRVIADSTGAPDWVGRLSPFAHLAPVPDLSPNWPAATFMVAAAVALTALGAVGYQRRDLRG
ncbi:ABC-2 type transport system permease protein [Micromonospora coriariae]|uniref:ABC-2 type transport system permease protein n=1 Tax=Micromonospora coriariae TaxID=285665 RepID=A0A1C4Y0F5_9ACTN|nr:polyketide antibiotic transporter [Micromonospora coriariae]SCF14209.1 ABC-2 type transport system permease protein [Micromonospora coriariae]